MLKVFYVVFLFWIDFFLFFFLAVRMSQYELYKKNFKAMSHGDVMFIIYTDELFHFWDLQVSANINLSPQIFSFWTFVLPISILSILEFEINFYFSFSIPIFKKYLFFFFLLYIFVSSILIIVFNSYWRPNFFL